MQISSRTIDDLKSAGHHFAAGALAFGLKLERNSYGCHFGMRSDLEASRAAYVRGWESARLATMATVEEVG